MYKQTIITIILSVVLVISALADVSHSRLQKIQSSNASVNKVQAAEPTTTFQTGNITTQNNSSEKYRHWFWLLPLLGLPFLILALIKRADNDLERELWPYKQYSVGTKGGISYGTNGSDEN